MKGILLTGDYKGAAWHSLRGADGEIQRILLRRGALWCVGEL